MFKIKLKRIKRNWKETDNWTGFRFINNYGNGSAFMVGKKLNDGNYEILDESGGKASSCYQVSLLKKYFESEMFKEIKDVQDQDNNEEW